MSVDIASLASAVGAGASIVTLAAAAAELIGRTRRIVRFELSSERIEVREKVDDADRARRTIAALENVSATEYALDQATRAHIDAEIDRAIKGLEARSA